MKIKRKIFKNIIINIINKWFWFPDFVPFIKIN